MVFVLATIGLALLVSYKLVMNGTNVHLVRPIIKCISFVMLPNNEISICLTCFGIYRRRFKPTQDYKLTCFAAWWGRRRVKHDVKEFYKEVR
jgi:hypothetical protein